MTDADVEIRVIDELASGRPIVALAHPRQRISGAIGVWRRGDVAAVICAHRCELAALPATLAALPGLERLDVGHNQLSTLPPLPPNLRELYIDDNAIAALPALPRLRVLDANRNRLASLPALDGIDFVYAAHNCLAAVPATTGVRYLNVSENPLGDSGALNALGDPALAERLEQAGVTALPDLFDCLPGLRELHLRGNALATLPPSLARLTELRVLDLRGNQIDALPAALRELGLHKLDLRWNPLREPPVWLDELRARGSLVYM